MKRKPKKKVYGKSKGKVKLGKRNYKQKYKADMV